jgi:3-phosphoshikimate 1-carboxyvinyltransferase
MEDMPDVAMTLAVVALFATGITHITGVQSWKVKETNRLQAMHNELTKLGAKVDITDNSIKITPPHKINQNIAIDTYNDHRMAMCFSILPFAGVPVTINDYECVGKTFANFFDIINNMLA